MFELGRRAKSEQSTRIKDWMKQVFLLGDETTLLVSELRCGEPGCPPVETVIAALNGGKRNATYKIPKKIGAVEFDDIAALTALPSDARCGCDDCDRD
jgi:hypothetical protein